MDTFIEFALEGIDWMANKAGAVLVLAAASPAAFFLRGGKLLRYGALAVFAVALALVLLSGEALAAALVVTVLSTLLVSAGALATRKRLAQAEERLDAMTLAIRELEIAEERRQAFSAKHSRATRYR